MSIEKIIKIKDITSYNDLTNRLSGAEIEVIWNVFNNIEYPVANYFSLLMRNKQDSALNKPAVDFVHEFADFLKGYDYKIGALTRLESILLIQDLYQEKDPVSFTLSNVTYVFDNLSDLHTLHAFLKERKKLKVPQLATDNIIFESAIKHGIRVKKEKESLVVSSALAIPLFNREDLDNLPQYTNDNYQKILNELQKKNAEQKALIQIKKEAITSALSLLREDFPNFIKVIDFIEEDLALYGRGVHPDIVKFEPILLGGAPGVGKTEFARRVSELFNVPLSFTDMSASSSPRVLGGSDSTWKDSKPGVIFNQLWEGNVANPIFFLDEIDKVPQNNHEGYALTSLYSLLETSSNNAFKDEFFPLPINTKYVNFIAAGNDIRKIPEPLLTRFNYFDIPKPEGKQLRNIAKSVMRSLLTKVFPEGHGLSGHLSENILDYVEQSDMSPRHMSRMFKHGFKNALKNNRVELILSDIETYSHDVTFSYSM